MWRFVEPALDAETRDAVWHLDFVLGRWAAAPDQRRAWRSLAEHLVRQLGGGQAPALLPGLVQARLGTVLMLAGYLQPPLAAVRVLTLGAHVGLEVRMLRDWGAAAIGIERNPIAVQTGVEVGVVPPEALVAADAGTYLAQAHAGESRYHLVVIAAPSDPAWPGWLAPASTRLTADGRLVVVAYWADLPVGWRTLATPCVEGTMGGLVVRRA